MSQGRSRNYVSRFAGTLCNRPVPMENRMSNARDIAINESLI